MSTKSGVMTCLKILLQCFALDAFCSEAKHCRSVLRPDFVDILQLSNWKKLLGFKTMQEKLENVVPTHTTIAKNFHLLFLLSYIVIGKFCLSKVSICLQRTISIVV